MCPGTFSRRGAVASATIYPCAECASSRSVFIVWKRSFLYDKNESCEAGFSACGGSRKRHSTIPPQCDPRGAFLSYRNEVSYTIEKDSGARRSLFSSSLDNRIFTQRAFCCFHMIFDGIGLHDIQVIAHISCCIHLFCAELFILRMELCTVCLYHVIDPV